MSRQLVLALLALLTAALLAPAVVQASSKQVMTFEAPEELLDDSLREVTLDEIQAFGVTRVRALVYWRDFSARASSRRKPRFDRSDHAAYPAETWGRLDRLVDSAARRGIELQLTLTGPVPTWATKRRRGHLNTPSAREFGRWVTAVARRFGDRVDLWSIWNEPNHPQFLKPQFSRGGAPRSPRIYRGLYIAAERAIHGVPGGRRDKVLFGETMPIGNSNTVAPLALLRGAMCLDADYRRTRSCAKLRIDGYAHHAYTGDLKPTFRHPNRDNVHLGALDRLVEALDRAARAGAIARGRPIYLTEFGIQSHPDPDAVGLARQAEYLAISERMAYVNPRVAAFSQYLLIDDKPRRGPRSNRYGGFETGLKTWRGRKKPSYDGFLLPLAVKRYGESDVLWGRVRAATGATEVEIQHKVGEGKWRLLRELTTTTSGVYGFGATHRKGQRYRVRWTRPGGETVTGPPIRAY